MHTMIGALVPTFLVRYLFLLAFRRLSRPVWQPLAANAASWLVCATVAAVAFTDGSKPMLVGTAVIYGVPQAFWLTVDLAWRQIRPEKSYDR
jgi:hypothetical protein